ncbi:MAG: sigma-70 family RNA polymerase sigma factor [Oscillospiraceae bacterium]|nr:sigma-70 family RNA polymerase sigma factor [Candidatus Limimonas coprohippi]MCQ2487769.1 sigma-70 family RNA polymerase sigma factor [Clostridia bacterium]
MDEIYIKYWPLLVADAKKRLKGNGFAEDCAQETFIVLFEKLKEGCVFDNEAQLVSFLLKTNANNAIHMRRFLARSNKATDVFIHTCDVPPRAYFEDYLLIKEEQKELNEALKNIPIHHAIATLYHYGYELTYSQIGEILKNNSESVRKFGNRGIKELKNEMLKKEDD